VNKQIIGALALLTLVACSKEAAEPPVAKALGSGITLENMDLSVRPGDDFFSYVKSK